MHKQVVHRFCIFWTHSDGCIIISLMTLEVILCKDPVIRLTAWHFSNIAVIIGVANITHQHPVILAKNKFTLLSSFPRSGADNHLLVLIVVGTPHLNVTDKRCGTNTYWAPILLSCFAYFGSSPLKRPALYAFCTLSFSESAGSQVSEMKMNFLSLVIAFWSHSIFIGRLKRWNSRNISGATFGIEESKNPSRFHFSA